MQTRYTTDRIEVLPETGHVQVRQLIELVDEEGNVIGYPKEGRYHRYVLEQGADLSGQPEDVRAVAEAAWKIKEGE